MSRLTGLPITDDDSDLDFAYLLGWHENLAPCCNTFVPYTSILVQTDKRSQFTKLSQSGVKMPKTHVFPDWTSVKAFIDQDSTRKWVLKWPTGCGSMGHQLLSRDFQPSALWTSPFLIQEFIELKQPEVFRIFCVDGQFFNWSVRRYPEGVDPVPWVACSKGAKVELIGQSPPAEILTQAQKSLSSMGLMQSFACVDFLRHKDSWLVIEVNTDGIFHYVSRSLNCPIYNKAIDDHIANAIRQRLL